jgi:hypothetical protein
MRRADGERPRQGNLAVDDGGAGKGRERRVTCGDYSGTVEVVSAEISALAGVIVGALLAGAGNLLLAWRDETIQARTGVYLIRRILEEALEEIHRLREQDPPRWPPEQLPDSKLWTQYRPAVSARLALARLQKIDIAMRRLDGLNGAAGRALKLKDDREERLWNAAERNDEEAFAQLKGEPDPMTLNEPAVRSLESGERDLRAALDTLVEVTPTGLPGRTRNMRAFKPWLRWHLRSVGAVAVTAIAVAVLAFVLSMGGPSDTSEVQDALAAHFDDPAFTACEPVHDHEGDYSCVVVETTTSSSCPTSAAAAPGIGAELARDVTAVSAEAEGSCELIKQALEYTAQRQHDDDCTAFFETAVSEVPGKASENGVPPVIDPGSAFTADC